MTDRDLAILVFERANPAMREGPKTAAIRERFDLTPVRYYQAVNRLLDAPEAAEHDPVTVNRLRRLRAARRRR